MLNESAISIANAYWASHLGYSLEQLFASPFSIVPHGHELANYCGAYALFRGNAAIVSIPPDRIAALRPQLSNLTTDCSPSHFASALDNAAVAVVGPTYIGIFINEHLVALAGCEVWGGSIAHISVVTHPDFRSRGFARGVVAHLAERAIRAGLLPQYRTLESNRASVRVAESLGFQQYATSMSVRLKRNV